MRSIVAIEHLTLDGVMQAPGSHGEDTRDGFDLGGWAAPDNDPVMGQAMGEGMGQGAELLFGRRTYENFAAVWQGRTDNPFSAILDASRKYVASRTLREPLPWQNSALLSGDAGQSVARLKTLPGADLVIMGSGDLLQTLMREGLVDEFVLMIHPSVLGRGRRLFNDGATRAAMRLTKSVTTTRGVVIATYRPAAGSKP